MLMLIKIRIPLLIIAFLLFTDITRAQKVTQKFASPIAAAKAVADKMLRTTPFQYQLVLQKPKSELDHIEWLNFGRTFGNSQPAVAYAKTTLTVSSDTSILVEVAHNDELKIWLNHVLVFQRRRMGPPDLSYRERAIDLGAAFTLNLKKGNNELLIKSATGSKHDWMFYMRAKKSTSRIKFAVSGLPFVSPEIEKTSNWLLIGPFPNLLKGGRYLGFNTAYEPEKEFEVGRLYQYGNQNIAWTIPKSELTVEGLGARGLWPGDYNSAWNYHPGGVAWAMGYLGAYTGEKQYLEYNRKYVDFYIDKAPFLKFQKYQLGGMDYSDFKIAESHMLDYSAAPALSFAYPLEHEPENPNRANYKALFNTIKNYLVKEQFRLPSGNFTRTNPHRFTTWADDMYMGLPFLVHASVISKNPAEKKSLLDDAAHQIFSFNKELWDEHDHLYHQAQYSDRKVNIPYWSRANGWAIWGISEVLLYLPKNHPLYTSLLTHYRAHIDALIKHQDKETGFWHNVIDKPDSFAETSGTAIFTFAIARGIRQGWLDKTQYSSAAIKGWQAVETMIEADGTLHGTCIGTNMSENVKDYYTRPVADDDTHGIFPVLFAGIEMDKLLKGI